MAENVAPLIAQLRADLNQFRAEMRNVDRITQQTSTSANRGFQSMTKQATLLERGIGGVGKQVIALGVGFFSLQAVIRGVGASVRIIGDFQQSMAGVLAVTQASTEQFERAEIAARQLGATTQFTASEAARGMEFLGRAGFKTNQIIAAMPAVLDLAAAATLSMGQAADIASNIMSGFGIAAEDFTKVADILAATAANANTNVQQLGEGMKFVAPVARALGISVQDTAAAMGVLSNAGLQASLAGTGLRRILSELSNPSNETAIAVENLGLRLSDLDPTMNSLMDIVTRFRSVTLSAADALTIFGDRGGPAILALTGQSTQLGELNDKLMDVEGTAKRMREIMADTLPGAIKKFQAATESLILSLGDSGLSKFLQGVIEKTAELVSQLNALSGAADPAGVALRDLQAEADSLRKNAGQGALLSAIFGDRSPDEAEKRLKVVEAAIALVTQQIQDQADEANILAEMLGRVNDGQQKALDNSQKESANRARKRRDKEQERIEQQLALKDMESLGEAAANLESDIEAAEVIAREYRDTLQEVTDQALGLDALGRAWGNLEGDIEKAEASARQFTKELDEVAAKQQRVIDEFQAQIQRSVSDTLLAGLKGEIRDIGDLLGGLTDIFLRQLTDMAAAALLKNIKIPVLFDASSTAQTGGGSLPFGVTGGQAFASTALLGAAAFQIAQIQDTQRQIAALVTGGIGGVVGGFFGGPTGAAAGFSVGSQIGQIIPLRDTQNFFSQQLNTATSPGVFLGGGATAGASITESFLGDAFGTPTPISGFFNDALGFTGLDLGQKKKPNPPQIRLAIEEVTLALVNDTIRAARDVVVDILTANKTPGNVETEIANALRDTLQDSFDETTDVINELPEQVREGLIAPLQATFNDITNDLGDLSFSGKDMVQEWNEFLRNTLPGQLEEELGPIIEGANIFRAGFAALEDAILSLQQQQIAALASIQTTRRGLAESLLNPDQLLALRQAELRQNVSAFESGDSARRLQLAPLIEQLASAVFTTGTQAFGVTLTQMTSTLQAFQTEVARLTGAIASLQTESDTRSLSLQGQAQSLLDSQRSAESLLRVEQQRLQDLLIAFDTSTSADRVILIRGIQEQVGAVNQAALSALATDTTNITQQAELLTIQNTSIDLLESLRDEIGADFATLISSEEAAIQELTTQQDALLSQQIVAQEALVLLQENTLGILDQLTLETSGAFSSLISEGLTQRESLINMVTGLDALKAANTEHFIAANSFLQRIELTTGIQTNAFGTFASDFDRNFAQDFEIGQTQVAFLTGIAESNLATQGLLNTSMGELVSSNDTQIDILNATNVLIAESNAFLATLAGATSVAPVLPPLPQLPPPTPPPPPPPSNPLPLDFQQALSAIFQLTQEGGSGARFLGLINQTTTASGFPIDPPSAGAQASLQRAITATSLLGIPFPDVSGQFPSRSASGPDPSAQLRATILSALGIDTPIQERSTLESFLRDFLINAGFTGFQHGTPFVPRTGVFQLHQGEAVIPASMNPFMQGGMGDTEIAVTINIDSIDGTDRSSVRVLTDNMAEQLIARVSAELLNRERLQKPRGMTTVR